MATNYITVTNFVTVVSTNAQSGISGLDVVNQVKDFFSTAYTQTIWLLGSLITILGFAIPAVYFWLAKIQLKIREKKLAEQLKKDFEEFGKKLENTLKAEIHDAKGGVCFVQGKYFLQSGDKKNALKSFIAMVDNFAMAATDFKNLQGSVRYLTGELEDFNKEDVSLEAANLFNKIIGPISKIQSGGLLDEDIEKLKNAFAEAQIREVK